MLWTRVEVGKVRAAPARNQDLSPWLWRMVHHQSAQPGLDQLAGTKQSRRACSQYHYIEPLAQKHLIADFQQRMLNGVAANKSVGTQLPGAEPA
jgi:hypothetical protein